MKTLLVLTIFVCAPVGALAQQVTASPSPSAAPAAYRQRSKRPKSISTKPAPSVAQPAPVEFHVGDARVDVTKDEIVVRLAMAQHGSIFIELPANDGPRYIIPGDPEMATVDEKALERNKRAIVVRPGSLFVPPLPNRKARTPAATVTAQMRSGLVVTFLFYPVEDLAQNVHRCVLSYNRDEVVARRRAAGLPVNLDTNVNQEMRIQTGQSTAPTSISVEDANEATSTEKHPETKATLGTGSGIATNSSPIPKNDADAKVDSMAPKTDERIMALTRDALSRAVKKPKQFKKWTKPAHGLALSVLRQNDSKNEFQIITIAVKNTSAEPLKLVPGSPDLLIEMRDDQGKAINLESIKKVHAEAEEPSHTIAPGTTVYYAVAYIAPVLGVHQQIKVVVGQTSAADEPASITLTNKRK